MQEEIFVLGFYKLAFLDFCVYGLLFAAKRDKLCEPLPGRLTFVVFFVGLLRALYCSKYDFEAFWFVELIGGLEIDYFEYAGIGGAEKLGYPVLVFVS